MGQGNNLRAKAVRKIDMENMMVLDKSAWKKYMDGFFVRDCTFGFEDGRLGFLIYEEVEADAHLEDGWQMRLLAVKLTNPIDTRFFYITTNSIGVGGMIASAWQPKQPEFVVAGIGREIYSYKPKEYKGRELEIPFDGKGYGYQDVGEVGCAITKTVRVGHTVFAVGAPMRVFERTAGQQWVTHEEIPIPAGLKLGRSDEEIRAALSDANLNDLAGLNEQEMYAVGHAGTLWQRTQDKWRQRAFPTNLDLFTVAVAPDGTAYITDRRCSVWKGQEERWERIVQADSTLPYQDSAWFAGRLWCTNDSAGPFVLEGKKMVPAHQAKKDPMPAQVACFAHRIDVSPDGKTMLVAGRHGAATYDGKTWTVLFDGMPDD